MTAVYVCECDHLPPDHHGSTYACRTAGCRCVRYTPDFQRPVDPFQAADADPAASAPYPLQHAPDALSTSARLAKAERERDEALAEAERLFGLAAKAMQERGEARAERDEMVARKARMQRDLDAELAAAREQLAVATVAARKTDLLRAELATARAELEQLRAFNAWIVAEHIHCPNPEGAPE